MVTYFSSIGRSKNDTPSFMTICVSSFGIPTFLRYRNPTSSRACRSCSRNWGLVEGSLASERLRMGMESKDMVKDWREMFANGTEEKL